MIKPLFSFNKNSLYPYYWKTNTLQMAKQQPLKRTTTPRKPKVKPPKKEDRVNIDRAIEDADRIVPLLLDGLYQKAMNELHGR